jgi:ATP-dependent DNA helicase RecG
VEIINPGGLPKGLSRKALGTISIRRNELIADMFYRLYKVERVGMGIKRMRSAMREAGLREPTFDTDGFFRAVFLRSSESEKKIGERIGERVGEKVGVKLTARQQKIVEAISTDPSISARDLSEKAGISARNVEANLATLKRKGVLQRVGPARGGHWEVVR